MSEPEANAVAGWETLGEVAPGGLAPSRISLHNAANVVAAAGNTLLPARADGATPPSPGSHRSARHRG